MRSHFFATGTDGGGVGRNFWGTITPLSSDLFTAAAGAGAAAPASEKAFFSAS